MVPGWLFKNRFGFLPEGVQVMVAKRLKFFQEPVDCMIGVLPFKLQVYLTVGLSDMPDSS